MPQSNFKEATVPVNVRSRHDLGNHHITTMSWGWLTPIYTLECVPGDVINYKPTIFVRTPALATTTFGNIKISQHSFFVPSRLLWKDHENFILGGDDGRQTYTKPYCLFGDLAALLCVDTAHRAGVVSNSDLFLDLLCADQSLPNPAHEDISYKERGLFSTTIYNIGLNPTSGVNSVGLQSGYQGVNTSVFDEKIDLMPFRAYQKIWWDYYRDSVLIPESAKDTYIKTSGGRQFIVNLGDPGSIGSETGVTQITARKKCYRKDYFTTAKVSPQQGSVSIVPVDIASTSLNPGLRQATQGSNLLLTGTAQSAENGRGVYSSQGVNDSKTSKIGQFSVEVLRVANSYQRWLEKNNAAGSRPIAQVLAHYGFTPSAERLDMAEYVDGEDRILDIQQVTSTAQTSEGDLAENAAYGIVRHFGSNQGYTCREHGYFMSLMAIEPMTGYCDGIDRMFQRFDKEDLFTPEYENLGYDAIANKELFTRLFDDPDVAQSPDQAFGFQPRYSSYKYKKDVLAGDFTRINTMETADAWHTFRRFGNVPALNSMFPEIHVEDHGNNWNRLFVNTNDDYDPFDCDILNENPMERSMNGFATPALANVNEQDGRHISIPYGGVRL